MLIKLNSILLFLIFSIIFLYFMVLSNLCQDKKNNNPETRNNVLIDSLKIDTSLNNIKPEISWKEYLQKKYKTKKDRYIPKEGCVPDEETAIKIAEAIWKPLFGDRILISKPFIAILTKNQTWIVTGNLRPGYTFFLPFIEMRKKDGKIIDIHWEK